MGIHATAVNVTHATVHQRPSRRLKRNHYVLVALVMTVLVIHATAVNVTHVTVHQRLSRKLDVVEIRKLKLQRRVDVAEIRKPKPQRRADVVEIRKPKLQRRVDVMEIRKLFNHKISQKLPSQLGVKRSQSKLKILIKQTYQNLICLKRINNSYKPLI